MADNTTLNTGTGGDVIATDDLTTLNGGASSGVKVQRSKIGFGPDGTLRDVDTANPLPTRTSDGTNLVVLKGASTATVAADPSLVVALSPNSPLPAGTLVIGKVSIDQTTPGTTNLVQVGGSLPAGTNKVGTVDIATAPAVAKGTQGANALPVQNLKDSGRVAKNITLDSFAIAATTETLNTMSYSSANGTVTTGTSYNVTAGKTFRVQSASFSLHTVASNTTAVNVIVRIRANAAGAAVVGSPIQLVVPIQGVAAANQAGIPVVIDFPDGWEFPGGAGIGFTSTCSGFVTTTAAPKLDITLVGYEY